MDSLFAQVDAYQQFVVRAIYPAAHAHSPSLTMSHPIALPAASHSQDYNMDPGSYTGEDGRFNPASYTRHFLGSPISWRAGSFGAQFVPSQSPTAMLVGSFE
jgi:hypothetical protein